MYCFMLSYHAEYEQAYAGCVMVISTDSLPPCLVNVSVLQTQYLLSSHLIHYLDMRMTTTWHSYELLQLCGVNNKNFVDPQTEIHSNNKLGAFIFRISKTNKKYNCACNMTFISLIYSCC